jgi:hypothetical protein
MKIKTLHLTLIIFATFNFQFLQLKIRAQAVFSSATNFASGASPYAIHCSDFNGDGKADLVVANLYAHEVSVFLGNGEGGFGIATIFPVGTNPRSVTSADFNGDGKIDLAVANYSDNNVSILLGNGTGIFGPATNFGTGIGYSPQSIICADFNADGKTDLALVNLSAHVTILLGNGAGGFAAAINFAVSGMPYSLTSADFNGDGKADLATANSNSNNITVLLGNGLGSLGTANNFALSGTPYSVISADFNGDGKVDLATANYNSNKVSVLLGNGAGGFLPPTEYGVGVAPNSIISSDFNADGKADLAVSNHTSNDVSVLLGNGTGGFEATTNFAVGAIPFSVTSSDFNEDGKIDLAVANFIDDNVSILLNNYLPSSAPICLVSVDPTLTHNVVVWEKTNLNISAIDSFIVYREITTNNYQRIGAVSADSLSIFDDFNANPASTAFRYKLKNKNTQGVLSLFSDYHNTMYLTHAGADFSWTPYQIENNTSPVSAYKIYRDNNATGNFQSIGTTTGNQLGFTDVNYASYPNSSYYVEAVMSTGSCEPTRSGFVASRSNVKYRGIAGVQQLNNHSTINIYPNPTDKTLNISGITGKTTLFLHDVAGKLIMEKEVENNATISISQFEEGIYTLLSESKAGWAFNKVVISR